MVITERGFGKMDIGGQVRGFHVGTYQSKVFCKVAGIELKDYFKELEKFNFENNMENNVIVCNLIYSALVAYATFKDETVDFTSDKVMFWADQADPNEVAKILLVMHQLNREAPKKSDA
jgi:hypothetical protein